jgi:hypothetical protein
LDRHARGLEFTLQRAGAKTEQRDSLIWKNLLTLIFPVVTLRADEFIRQRLSGNQRRRY